MRENYRNLNTQRILDKLHFDQQGYDTRLLAYRKSYKYKDFDKRIKQLNENLSINSIKENKRYDHNNGNDEHIDYYE